MLEKEKGQEFPPQVQTYNIEYTQKERERGGGERKDEEGEEYSENQESGKDHHKDKQREEERKIEEERERKKKAYMKKAMVHVREMLLLHEMQRFVLRVIKWQRRVKKKTTVTSGYQVERERKRRLRKQVHQYPFASKDKGLLKHKPFNGLTLET